MTFQCSVCGLAHDEWPPGYGFSQPDAVWAMSPKQKRGRVMETQDYCCIDGNRCFIQTNLQIPVAGLDAPWVLSLWVEIAPADFSRFLGSYADDAVTASPVDGVIANHMAAFPEAAGAAVVVHFGSSRVRPTLVATGRDTDIGKAQHTGLSQHELHALLAAMGYDDAG